jgi:uncharacterized metal-binding protein YceD (DUF177 family)
MQPLPAPEFSRPMSPEALAAKGDAVITGTANPDECMALAARFDVPRVMMLSFRLKASPFGRGGWRVTGNAEARLEQTCVVTLEPIETEISEAVDRRFVPAREVSTAAPGSETELSATLADEPDGFDGMIDFGEIAAEAIALGIDPYPRRGDVEAVRIQTGPAGVAPLTDEAARPFAGLAALRQRTQDGG